MKTKKSKLSKPVEKKARKQVSRSKDAGRGAAATPKKANRITEVVYETARGLYDAGAISKTTMREFDELCLPPVPTYTAKQIKEIRTRCKASQRVFAAYLNMSPSALQKWETGARKPDSIAFKLLSLVDKKGLEALAV